MEREQLEQHQATIRGLRDSIATIQQDANAAPATLIHLVGIVETLAEVVNDLIDERIDVGAHAAAVARSIKGPGVERSGDTIADIAKNPEPRD